ncbi:hypothetical protein OC844_007425 [Tilletia horrida]|nr:hypothetical protein OC844_007425 [Tilletia horrida]
MRSALLRRWQQLVTQARPPHERAGVAQEVRWAFDHCCSSSSSSSSSPDSTTRSQRDDLRRACLRLARGEPLGYALGSTPFASLPHPLAIHPPVLIPRPETEEWAARLATALLSTHTHTHDTDIRILDIGTGSGCIAILLAHSLLQHGQPSSSIHVHATDISPVAFKLAQHNAYDRLHLSPAHIHFHHADLFDDTAMQTVFRAAFGNPSFVDEDGSKRRRRRRRRIHLLVSNPPYITPADYATSLPPSVALFEDARALVGIHPRSALSPFSSSSSSNDTDETAGLTFYRRIAHLCAQHRSTLFPPSPSVSPRLPHIVLEVGHGQAHAVSRIMADALDSFQSQDHVHTEIVPDAWGIDRVVQVTITVTSTPTPTPSHPTAGEGSL